MKLFVGRLPREGTQRLLRDCFEEFGEVLEVFVIDSMAQSGVGCAFIRMATVDQAESAIAELHEQRVLVPDQRDMGPMQVAFAKGEAVRLGIHEKEEILPSFKEARMKVVEHNEKRHFFETMKNQHEEQHKLMQEQHKILSWASNATQLRTEELIQIVKDGQRFGNHGFKQKWWSYCDQGWGGVYDYDPGHHAHETLAQFITLSGFEHGLEPWFKKPFEEKDMPVPPMPPGMVPMPGMPMPGMPPFGGPMGPPTGPSSSGPPGGPRRRSPARGPPGPRRFTEPKATASQKLQDYADVDALSESSESANLEDINVDDI